MSKDFYPVGSGYREPVQRRMRFTGAGAAVPTANANCPDALTATLTRSGVGTLSLATTERSGWTQGYGVEVQQAASSTVGPKTVRTVAVDGVWPMTFAMQVVYSSNAANVDVAAGEELVVYLDLSNGKP